MNQQMTLEQAAAVLKEHQRRQRRKQLVERAKENLIDAIQYLNPVYEVNWHHEEICDQLMRLTYEDLLRLTIWVPPRYGKSEIVSKMLPCFLLGLNPKLKIIIASYSAELAEDFNIQIQEIMASPEYREIFPDTKLTSARRNRTRTDKGGYVYAVGVGGTLTGKGADLLIIDDPIKDHLEATSKTKQNRLINWYNSVAQTRLSKKASIIIMHTRWHKRDLAGYVIKKGEDEQDASQFEVICFPAAYDPDHEFVSDLDHRTYKGEALWPGFRENDEELMKKKADVGSMTWAALFRQSPKVEGGNIIKESDIQLYTQLPFDPAKLKSSDIIQSWDMTFKETGTSYVVGVTFCKYQADFYLVDIWRKKAGIVESSQAVTNMANRWPNCYQILIEGKANGEGIKDILKKKVTGIRTVEPDGSKDERLVLVAPLFESHNVFIPANHPLTKTIIDELTEFPSSENDDIVDAISQGLTKFTKLSGLRYLRAYKR